MSFYRDIAFVFYYDLLFFNTWFSRNNSCDFYI
jgi:hypothetical protein